MITGFNESIKAIILNYCSCFKMIFIVIRKVLKINLESISDAIMTKKTSKLFKMGRKLFVW